jgi:hypothetical protein
MPTQVLQELLVKVMLVVPAHNHIHSVVAVVAVQEPLVVMAHLSAPAVLDFHLQLLEVEFFVLAEVVRGMLFLVVQVVMEVAAAVLTTEHFTVVQALPILVAVAAAVQDFNLLMQEELEVQV